MYVDYFGTTGLQQLLDPHGFGLGPVQGYIVMTQHTFAGSCPRLHQWSSARSRHEGDLQEDPKRKADKGHRAFVYNKLRIFCNTSI